MKKNFSRQKSVILIFSVIFPILFIFTIYFDIVSEDSKFHFSSEQFLKNIKELRQYLYYSLFTPNISSDFLPKHPNIEKNTKYFSSQKDVVFLYSDQINKGLLFCIESLRRFNSKCTIVLFTTLKGRNENTINLPLSDFLLENQSNYLSHQRNSSNYNKYIENMNYKYITHNHHIKTERKKQSSVWNFFNYIPNNIEEFFSQNKVVVYTVYNQNKSYYSPHQDRYDCEYFYLKEHLNNRRFVLHIDSFDVFFQSDPFAPYYEKSKPYINFVGEGFYIKNCFWNKKWILTCFSYKEYEEIKYKEIICSGTIIGNSYLYFKFLYTLLSMEEWHSCKGDSLDQAFINILVHSERLNHLNISFSITSCDGPILTMSKCMSKKDIPISKSNKIIGNGKIIPSIVHQYNRFTDLHII